MAPAISRWPRASGSPNSSRGTVIAGVSLLAASSMTRRKTAHMPAAPGVEERDNIPAGVRFRDGPRPIANVSDPGLLFVEATAVQRRGAGAEGPGGAGVEATRVGGAAGSGRGPTILISVPHD